MTKIDIFRNFRTFSLKSHFFRNFDFKFWLWKNRNFWKLSTAIEMFRKFDQNRNFQNFLKFWLIPNFFSKIWPKLKFFENYDQNRNFFENFTKIEIFRNFRKFWLRSIFFRKFDQNRNFSKIWPKTEIFRKLRPKLKFFETFANFD